MKRKSLILLLFLQVVLSYGARPDSIRMTGFVYDSFTREGIAQARLLILRPDSSLVAIGQTFSKIRYSPYEYYNAGEYKIGIPEGGKYLVKIEKEGYQTSYSSIIIPQRKYAKWVRDWNEDFLISKMAIHEVIGASIVRATKIKMILKGDTVAFNADAFQLSNGSMLDQLFKKLPGIEMKKGGVIVYNGQEVQSLLVNGKNFFNGNVKIALDNIPSYIVNNIKIYHKEDESSYLLQNKAEKDKTKKLVVDVNLKKQYGEGWISNAEIGSGTNERYSVKLFGMRYTNCTQFYVFGTMNNLNKMEKAGDDGAWISNSVLDGEAKTNKGGINFNWNAKKNKTRYSGSMETSYYQINNQQLSSSETYLSGGNTFLRSDINGANKQTMWNFFHEFNYPGKKVFLCAYHGLNYNRERHYGLARSLLFNSNPLDGYRGASIDSIFQMIGSQRLKKMLINNVSDQSSSLNKSLDIWGNMRIMIHSPIFGNVISAYLKGEYNRIDLDLFSHYNLRSHYDESEDFRNRYTLQPTRNYYYQGQLDYNLCLNDRVSLNLRYQYKQSYDKGDRQLFRLDSLSGWDNSENHILGTLPSTRDSLLQCLDFENTFHTIKLKKEHQLGCTVNLDMKKAGTLSVSFPLQMNEHKITNDRDQRHQMKNNQMTALNPDLEYIKSTSKQSGSKNLLFRYQWIHTQPDLNNLLDIQDLSNPLFIQLGNSDLQNTVEHKVSLSNSILRKRHQQYANFGLSYDVWKNAVAQSFTYNRQTGVTTYHPQNINGNWMMGGNFDYGRTLDSLNRFNVSQSLNLNYGNNTDYVLETNGEILEPYRNNVRNFKLVENVSVAYSLKDMYYELHAGAGWTSLTCGKENFERVSAFDIQYGAKVLISMMWGLKINMDLTLYSRRGYNDASMNDDNLVWNADITKSFLKSKNLILKLEGFDLLHQLDNVRTEVNAQGRTETWYNVVPSYLMLHLIYKLNVLPKKK